MTNRRYYTDEDLAVALRQPRKPKADRRTIGYCRVSSQAQKPDLVNQQKFLEQFCQQRQIVVDEWIMEIGGGLNFKRKRFLALVDAIITWLVLATRYWLISVRPMIANSWS